MNIFLFSKWRGKKKERKKERKKEKKAPKGPAGASSFSLSSGAYSIILRPPLLSFLLVPSIPQRILTSHQQENDSSPPPYPHSLPPAKPWRHGGQNPPPPLAGHLARRRWRHGGRNPPPPLAGHLARRRWRAAPTSVGRGASRKITPQFISNWPDCPTLQTGRSKRKRDDDDDGDDIKWENKNGHRLDFHFFLN